jgi:pyridoxal phosphate enzyme (YggS family)
MADRALVDTLRRNTAAIRNHIRQAAHQAGRRPEDVRLVAVSKTFPQTHIHAAVEAGLHHLGENRVQEALQKIARSTELQIEWHLIGHLQGNKARNAAAAFHWIHSVDSVKILRRIDQAASDQGATPRLLVQVDLAGEAAKYGASPDETRRILDAAPSCKAATVRGLMIIPPWNDDPEQARPYFRRLRELRDELVSAGVDAGVARELSMGMSHDFEVAIQEGATMVRVGTAIFGRRPPPAERETSA